MGESTWVEGRLRRVLWASASSGYAVVRLQGADELEFVAVGMLADLVDHAEGAFLALEGRWEEHPVHGRQFRCSGTLHGSPRSLEGMQLYLASSGVKGVGPKVAAALVEHFGLSTPTVLATEPQRLTEVSGIGPAKARAIREAWSRDEEGRALAMTLRGLGVSQRLVQRIRDRYGDRAPAVVRGEPYRLAEEIRGIGFRTADALARQLGVPDDDPARQQAAVAHALDEASRDGHCFTPSDELSRRVRALGVPTDHLDEAIAAAEGRGRIVVDAEGLWPTHLFDAEMAVARELLRLAEAAERKVDDEAIARAEAWERVTLDPTQRAAVRRALAGGVVVITGGPGTGKTTLLRVLARVVRESGEPWLLASPTGRAARRLAEATGQEASTLHRLLELDPGNGGFGRAAGNPLETDGVVVDEVSMVDIELMSALLLALPFDHPQLALVLVGDADQLPSVGPGQVLRDLVDSDVIPVVRLDTIHRQGTDSGIVVAAQHVHHGHVPVSGERSGSRDVFLLDRPDAEAALATLVQVVSQRLPANGYDPFDDVQVLAPTRRGPLGAERLNHVLQEVLNPDGEELVRGERRYRVGDRVICTRNRYDVEVFNGDVGRVRRIDGANLQVDFDGRIVDWARDDLPLLDLAYAVTVHKSQGSEYPAVVLALHGAHGIMLRRNLFYTAVTRARRFLVVVGQRRAWARAVSEQGGDERRTALARRLTRRGEWLAPPEDSALL